MGIGSAIRHRMGRLEGPITDFYRGRYINLDDLSATLASFTTARRILEIGCGEGNLANRLVRDFPDAEYVGLDIGSVPGRQFTGDTARVTFRSVSTADLVSEGVERFDLVLLVDVVHHVPDDERPGLLKEAASLTAPGGLLVVKDWESTPGLATRMAYVSDRYVSGDRNVRFPSGPELRSLLESSLPGMELVLETRIPPRRNNLLLAYRQT